MGRTWGRYSSDSMDVEDYDPRYDEPEEVFKGEDSLVERMEQNGYEWCDIDCRWEKVFSVSSHVCTRNDHKDGTVKLGQRYRITGVRATYTDGTSKQFFYKKVVQ